MPDPVTEQFLSASKTTELLAGKAAVDHVHEDTGGGGGGGFTPKLAECITNNAASTQRTTGEGGVTDGSLVWDEPLDPWTNDSVTHVTVGSGGTAGKLILAETGFYIVQLNGYFTFPIGTDVTYVKTSFTIATGYAGSFLGMWSPTLDYEGKPIFNFTLTTSPVYSNGFQQISPNIKWNEGIYTATMARLSAAIARIA